MTAVFVRALFRGRCRRRLLAGACLLAVAIAYGSYAGWAFGRRGGDDPLIDRPLAWLARSLTPPPVHLGSVVPENNRELYLVTVISDQQDTMFGLTLLVLRMILALTIGGFGLVLMTAGATEWEVLSEAVGKPTGKGLGARD
jgi:hypothetical protein